MVKGGVENGPRVGVRGLDLHLGELLVPGLGRVSHDSLEIPSGKLGLEILFGVLLAHRGDRDLDHHLVALGGLEVRPAEIFRDDIQRLERLAELGVEEYLLVLGPAGGETVALDGLVPHSLDRGVIDPVPATTVLKVDHDRGLVGGREGVTAEAHPACGGHLGGDPVAGQWHAVIAGLGDLLGTVGVGPEARRGVFLDAAGVGHLTGHGHQGDVEQVADTGAAQMGVGEPDHRRVALMVAGAPVPSLGDAGGAELDGAERHAGAHEHVAVAPGAYLHVDIFGEILL